MTMTCYAIAAHDSDGNRKYLPVLRRGLDAPQ